MPAKASQDKLDYKHSSFSAAQSTKDLGSLQSLSEKEETEKELDFKLELAFNVLPFLAPESVNADQLPISQAHVVHCAGASSPVYLLHANFRI